MRRLPLSLVRNTLCLTLAASSLGACLTSEDASEDTNNAANNSSANNSTANNSTANNSTANNTPANNANSGETTLHDSEIITEPTTWSGKHRLKGNLTVQSALVLEPCTDIAIDPDLVINVRDNGSIQALGTAECPVKFHSSKATPAAGDWAQVEIYGSASNETVFQHTEFHHAGGDNYGAVWVEEGGTVAFDQVQVKDIANDGLHFANGASIRKFEGVSFDAIGRHPLVVGANEVGKLGLFNVGQAAKPFVDVLNSVIKADATWILQPVPYQLPDVTTNAVWTLAAGVTLKLKADVVLTVRDGGSIRAEGTAEAPVTIESFKSSPAAGDWAQIEIYGSSSNENLLRHAMVRHGGGDNYGALWIEEGGQVTIENSVFEQNTNCDVYYSGGGGATVGGEGYTVCPQR